MCRHCAGNFESFSHLSIASSHFTFEKIKGNNSEETWPKPHCFDGTPVRWKRIWGMHSFVYRSLYGVNWLWCFVLFCFFVCFSPQSSLACLIYGHINICNSGAVWVEIQICVSSIIQMEINAIWVDGISHPRITVTEARRRQWMFQSSSQWKRVIVEGR